MELVQVGIVALLPAADCASFVRLLASLADVDDEMTPAAIRGFAAR